MKTWTCGASANRSRAAWASAQGPSLHVFAVLGNEPLGRAQTPRFLEQVAEVVRVDARKSHQDPGISLLMV